MTCKYKRTFRKVLEKEEDMAIDLQQTCISTDIDKRMQLVTGHSNQFKVIIAAQQMTTQ